MTERPQSQGEEIANSVSHGVGSSRPLASAPVLIATAAKTGTSINVVGASVFAVTMVLLYCASTLYHVASRDELKALLRKLDHGAIFLLIAGTYTPFTLGPLSGPVGWTLFGVIWSLAVIGVTLKAFDRIEHPLASLGLYLVMGWLCVVVDRPLAATGAAARAAAARRRRPLVHGRRGVLHARFAAALRPLHLAPVRARRNGLPLLRRPRLRRLAVRRSQCIEGGWLDASRGAAGLAGARRDHSYERSRRTRRRRLLRR